MKILITGADGQLGRELQAVLKDHELVLAVWPQFDLLKPGVEEFIRAGRPDVVIHAAAYTDVDGAEREPDTAFAVNAGGTERIARAAAQVGARLIYLSTDYVFDGRKAAPYLETDQPNPLSAYGRSKLEGERLAMAVSPRTLVVRTSWLYGPHGKNFVRTIMGLVSEQPELKVVADQRGCPTYAHDLAAGLARLIELDTSNLEPRTLHLTGAGDCTWHELACAIASYMGGTTRVRAISTSELNRPAPRPSYSVLANRVLATRGVTLPHWKDALVRFMGKVKAEAEVEHKKHVRA
jgi:dTDP-4-dehydrorhamnose reductase